MTFVSFCTKGCKLNDITIVYTPWTNLKKTGSMEVGQVGFHDEKNVRKYKIAEKKNNAILNRINKTKVEHAPNLAKDKADREAKDREREKSKKKELLQKEKEEIERKKHEQEVRNYTTLMDPSKMQDSSTPKTVKELEEDFW
jgi:hypothetical protein